MRSTAFVRGFNSGQTSTSKCVPSRTPIMAPSITIQMKKKRAISSVQIQAGMRPVCRAIICSVTGTTSIGDARPKQPVQQPGVAVDEFAHFFLCLAECGQKNPAGARSAPAWIRCRSRYIELILL